jgi:hypothetical protein
MASSPYQRKRPRPLLERLKGRFRPRPERLGEPPIGREDRQSSAPLLSRISTRLSCTSARGGLTSRRLEPGSMTLSSGTHLEGEPTTQNLSSSPTPRLGSRFWAITSRLAARRADRIPLTERLRMQAPRNQRLLEGLPSNERERRLTLQERLMHPALKDRLTPMTKVHSGMLTAQLDNQSGDGNEVDRIINGGSNGSTSGAEAVTTTTPGPPALEVLTQALRPGATGSIRRSQNRVWIRNSSSSCPPDETYLPSSSDLAPRQELVLSSKTSPETTKKSSGSLDRNPGAPSSHPSLSLLSSKTSSLNSTFSSATRVNRKRSPPKETGSVPGRSGPELSHSFSGTGRMNSTPTPTSFEVTSGGINRECTETSLLSIGESGKSFPSQPRACTLTSTPSLASRCHTSSQEEGTTAAHRTRRRLPVRDTPKSEPVRTERQLVRSVETGTQTAAGTRTKTALGGTSAPTADPHPTGKVTGIVRGPLGLPKSPDKNPLESNDASGPVYPPTKRPRLSNEKLKIKNNLGSHQVNPPAYLSCFSETSFSIGLLNEPDMPDEFSDNPTKDDLATSHSRFRLRRTNLRSLSFLPRYLRGYGWNEDSDCSSITIRRTLSDSPLP